MILNLVWNGPWQTVIYIHIQYTCTYCTCTFNSVCVSEMNSGQMPERTHTWAFIAISAGLQDVSLSHRRWYINVPTSKFHVSSLCSWHSDTVYRKCQDFCVQNKGGTLTQGLNPKNKNNWITEEKKQANMTKNNLVRKDAKNQYDDMRSSSTVFFVL